MGGCRETVKAERPGTAAIRFTHPPPGLTIWAITRTQEYPMAIEKKPAKNEKKAPAKTMKEKRADKAAKKAAK